MAVGDVSITFKSDEDAGSGWPNILRLSAAPGSSDGGFADLIAGDFMSRTTVLNEDFPGDAGTDLWVRVVMKSATGRTSTQYVFSESSAGALGPHIAPLVSADELWLPFGGPQCSTLILAERIA